MKTCDACHPPIFTHCSGSEDAHEEHSENGEESAEELDATPQFSKLQHHPATRNPEVLEHGFSRKDDHENKAKQMKDALKQAAKENEDGIKWGGKLSAADSASGTQHTRDAQAHTDHSNIQETDGETNSSP